MATIGGVRATFLEETRVARYMTLAESAGGFTIPDPITKSTDRHFQGIEFPGVIEIASAIFFRTTHSGTPRFSVRINDASLIQYTFTDNDPPQQTWHTIIPAQVPGGPVLRAQNNELVFFANDGVVQFGDVVILYTSDELTVKVPIVITIKA